VKGWQRVIHPEGGLYFYDATRVCRIPFRLFPVLILPKRVFTETNLRQPKVLKTVNDLVDILLSEAGDLVDNLTYLAVELPDPKSGVCNYYFVQHDKQLLFWVQDFDNSMRIYENVEGVKYDTHISGCLLVLS
jgi:hypothetical protein